MTKKERDEKYLKFIQKCKDHDWEHLSVCCQPGSEYKILISAIYDSYHTDSHKRWENGLSLYEPYLSTNLAPLFDGLEVNIVDFYRAYMIAKCETIDDLPALNDNLVAEKIKQFVQKHKMELYTPQIKGDLLKTISSCFGDFNVTEADRKTAMEQQKLESLLYKEAAMKIQKICNTDSVVTKVPAHGCKIDMPNLSIDEIKKYTDYMKIAGMDVKLFYYPKKDVKDYFHPAEFELEKGIGFCGDIYELINQLNKIIPKDNLPSITTFSQFSSSNIQSRGIIDKQSRSTSPHYY